MIAYGNTDVGSKRKINQDCFYYQSSPIGNLPNIFIVADGMGGHKAGDVASRTAVDVIVKTIRSLKSSDPVSIMEKAIETANDDVLKLSQSDPGYAGMGTTIVMATFCDDMIYIANIGDSRLYVVNDEIRQITRDHSYVQELVSMGKIDKKSARTHERKNELTRALGVAPDTVADFFEIKKEEGSRILICTDGLSNMVDDDEIRKIIRAESNIEIAVKKLIDKANENGGMDNITSLLIEA